MLWFIGAGAVGFCAYLYFQVDSVLFKLQRNIEDIQQMVLDIHNALDLNSDPEDALPGEEWVHNTLKEIQNAKPSDFDRVD